MGCKQSTETKPQQPQDTQGSRASLDSLDTPSNYDDNDAQGQRYDSISTTLTMDDDSAEDSLHTTSSSHSTLKTSRSPIVSYEGRISTGTTSSTPSPKKPAVGGMYSGGKSSKETSQSQPLAPSEGSGKSRLENKHDTNAKGVVTANNPNDDDATPADEAHRPTHEYTCLKTHLIGKGGTATVYLGAMKELGNPAAKAVPVAVKSVDINDAKQLSIIAEEYNTLKAMTDCPQIVRVFHFEHLEEKKKGRIYMELCKKGSLRALVKKCTPQRRLHELFIRAYMRDALKGLVFLHSRGIIHRDFKPENMLVWERYEPPADCEATIPFYLTAACAGAAGASPQLSSTHVKLSDFGTSKYTLHGICATTVNVVGTVPYMSPECIKGKFTEASDVWAWGISFLELATPGQMVWDHLGCKDSYGLLLKIGMLEPPHHHPPICDYLSDDAKKILARCFQTAWADRPSAQELLDDSYFRCTDAEFMQRNGVESAEEYAASS